MICLWVLLIVFRKDTWRNLCVLLCLMMMMSSKKCAKKCPSFNRKEQPNTEVCVCHGVGWGKPEGQKRKQRQNLFIRLTRLKPSFSLKRLASGIYALGAPLGHGYPWPYGAPMLCGCLLKTFLSTGPTRFNTFPIGILDTLPLFKYLLFHNTTDPDTMTHLNSSHIPDSESPRIAPSARPRPGLVELTSTTVVMDILLNFCNLESITNLSKTCMDMAAYIDLDGSNPNHSYLRYRARTKFTPEGLKHAITLVRVDELGVDSLLKRDVASRRTIINTILDSAYANNDNMSTLSASTLFHICQVQELASRAVGFMLDSIHRFPHFQDGRPEKQPQWARGDTDPEFSVTLQACRDNIPKYAEACSPNELGRMERAFLNAELFSVLYVAGLTDCLIESMERWKLEEVTTVMEIIGCRAFARRFRKFNNNVKPNDPSYVDMMSVDKHATFNQGFIGKRLTARQPDGGGRKLISHFSGDENHATTPNLAWCHYASYFPFGPEADKSEEELLLKLPLVPGTTGFGPGYVIVRGYRYYGWVFWDEKIITRLGLGSRSQMNDDRTRNHCLLAETVIHHVLDQSEGIFGGDLMHTPLFPDFGS
ncbi:hypothetical protein QBC38DRAFT_87973 [Podospora fimiseda]|uniref:Uncharacterized protein n=1 Tax=Podospora fimiseda TaxID=252190 RepID=A0AAN6YT88_9PEZI|nr:hypothetical protein QBC38DRAFT_87973 [Podospora fimiseda]